MGRFAFEFLTTAADAARADVDADLAWRARLAAEGRFGGGGAFGDGSGFVVVLRNVDRLQAEAAARSHPWVEAGLGSWSLRPWEPYPS